MSRFQLWRATRSMLVGLEAATQMGGCGVWIGLVESYVIKAPELAAVVEGLGRRPGPGHHLHRLFKAPGRLVHWNVELVKLTPLIAAPHPQIQTPVAQQVDRCRLF